MCVLCLYKMEAKNAPKSREVPLSILRCVGLSAVRALRRVSTSHYQVFVWIVANRRFVVAVALALIRSPSFVIFRRVPELIVRVCHASQYPRMMQSFVRQRPAQHSARDVWHTGSAMSELEKYYRILSRDTIRFSSFYPGPNTIPDRTLALDLPREAC